MDRLFITKQLGDGAYEAMRLTLQQAEQKVTLADRIARESLEVRFEYRECLVDTKECGSEALAKAYANRVGPLQRQFDAISGPLEQIAGQYQLGKHY
ncbi:hypothetical protein H6504_04015 [Candidatus Woesearchaeota archaeon]|nr:hypothetical protein [Candidatus Woesearchaeota archaeon]